MKNKKVTIVLAIIAVVIVFVVSLVLVVNSLNKKAEEEKKNGNNVDKYYVNFKENVDKFISVRDKYYEVVIDDLYEESVGEDYDDWLVELDNYKNLVDSIIDSAKPLKNLCVNKTYSDEKVNNKCVAYVKNYETVMNCFVDDISEYNNFINDYLKKNKKSNAKAYDLNSKIYNYIDLDGDKQFTGKK